MPMFNRFYDDLHVHLGGTLPRKKSLGEKIELGIVWIMMIASIGLMCYSIYMEFGGI